MKKKMVGFLVCTLLVIPIFSSTMATENNSGLKIGLNVINIRKFCAYINNDDVITATNVSWTIFINDPDVMNWYWNGTIASLAPGESELICTGKLTFGIRFIGAMVNVTADGFEPVEEFLSGIYFLFVCIVFP